MWRLRAKQKKFPVSAVGMVQEVNNLSDDYPDEMDRLKVFTETLGLEFNKIFRKGHRSCRSI